MIKQIKIENYKSIPSLELDLGRVNVFIGENGSGKTNILEAVALGSAAAASKLDSEFLATRGVRTTSGEKMVSGFDKEFWDKKILIKFTGQSGVEFFSNIEVMFGEWRDYNSYDSIDRSIWTSAVFKEKALQLKADSNQDEVNNLINKLDENDFNVENYEKSIISIGIDKFLLYAPENTYLRRFEEEGQIRPLGIRGEGLFGHLADLSRKEPETFKKINESLRLIDWFEGFEIPNDLMFTERRIQIKDRYLEEGIQYIDQRSSNEGFLYLLFYVTLFVSPYTPKFFAIDNVDNALNPKLCSKLLEVLVKLAKEHDKQVILTAHNPGLLDGLNLHDDEQRLFVISRNKEGHTNALRIEQKPSTNGHEPVRLSEQFLRGYIGGLPKNF